MYGFSQAATSGWGGASTGGPIVAGVILLGAFVAVERRVAHPLVPLAIIANRTRGPAYLSALIAGIGLIGAFLLITYYLQDVLGFSPLRAGLAFLPFIAGVVAAANFVSNRGLDRFGPKVVVPVGMILAAGGAGWLTGLGVHGGYGTRVAPATASTAKTTLTYRHQRQDRYSVRTPPRIRPTAPPPPAIAV